MVVNLRQKMRQKNETNGIWVKKEIQSTKSEVGADIEN